MEVDRKSLVLVGIAVFALFIMGAVLAFKTQVKEAMASQSSEETISQAELQN